MVDFEEHLGRHLRQELLFVYIARNDHDIRFAKTKKQLSANFEGRSAVAEPLFHTGPGMFSENCANGFKASKEVH